MRILYVLTSLGVGGAEKQTIALAGRMAAKGHTVAILSLKHAEEEWPVKLPVLRLNLQKTPLGIWRGLAFARKFAELIRPEVIHSHTFPANLFARLLCLPKGADGALPAVVNTIHNVYEGGWHRRAIYRVTRFMATAITAVSMDAADGHAGRKGAARRRIEVLTNGIDDRAFTPDPKRRRRARSAMQAGDRFVWLAVGRLAPAKDYPNLLRAWVTVSGRHANARLWIAGEGDPQTLGLEASLLSEVEGSVAWLGLRRDVADLLDAADGYVLSSAWEGMPLSVGEAMAMEKPVVATDVGGVRELAGMARAGHERPGQAGAEQAGLVVPPHDSAALANAMLEIMAMPEAERRILGREARARIELNFSMDAKAEEWERLYQRVIAGRKA